MKRLLRTISACVLCLILVQSHLLAADALPVLWLEAGAEKTLSLVQKQEAQHWTLEAGHRVIARGSLLDVPRAQAADLVQLAIKTPPLKPSVTLEATLLFDGVPVRKIILAAPSPFVDVDQWCKENPIALYDPDGKTAETFEREEIAFTSLRSFAAIENSENAVLVIGAGTDFDTEKGLAALLFAKAQNGGKILVLPPAETIPLVWDCAIESFCLQKQLKDVFPRGSERESGAFWTLRRGDAESITLVKETLTKTQDATRLTVLDIRFSSGRMIFDSQLQLTLWDSDVESRYYFKSLVETLSKNEEH